MILTLERYRAIRSDHDGANGFAAKMCPTCQTIHPCLYWIMSSDMVERLEQDTGARR